MKLGGFQPDSIPGGISDALLANQRLNIGIFHDVWRQVGMGEADALEGWEKIEGGAANKLFFSETPAMILLWLMSSSIALL